jgi:hypothetical protein
MREGEEQQFAVVIQHLVYYGDEFDCQVIAHAVAALSARTSTVGPSVDVVSCMMVLMIVLHSVG